MGQNQQFLMQNAGGKSDSSVWSQGYIKGKWSSNKVRGNIFSNWKNRALNAPFCLIFKSFLYFLLKCKRNLCIKAKSNEFLCFSGCVELKMWKIKKGLGNKYPSFSFYIPLVTASTSHFVTKTADFGPFWDQTECWISCKLIPKA